MALVGYASSSDDDEPRIKGDEEGKQQLQKEIEGPEEKRSHFQAPPSVSPSPDNDSTYSRKSPLTEQTEETSHQPKSSGLKLPDASLLLDSPALPSHFATATDHSSRVAAAMAESASRKRELNGSASHLRNKIPKGTLPYPKNIPDTEGGRLLPPQLKGRSNIVTEDISKLFVRTKKNADASSDASSQ